MSLLAQTVNVQTVAKNGKPDKPLDFDPRVVSEVTSSIAKTDADRGKHRITEAASRIVQARRIYAAYVGTRQTKKATMEIFGLRHDRFAGLERIVTLASGMENASAVTEEVADAVIRAWSGNDKRSDRSVDPGENKGKVSRLELIRRAERTWSNKGSDKTRSTFLADCGHAYDKNAAQRETDAARKAKPNPVQTTTPSSQSGQTVAERDLEATVASLVRKALASVAS